jgi:glycosyltransferase involved in cell wall biosynthesis
MKKLEDIFVSATFVVDEYAEDVGERINRLAEILRKRYTNYELVIVDNGLFVDQLNEVKALLPQTPCIRLLRLSRSYDTDTAIFAGVEASIGDYICVIYDNDPVDLVPEFVKKTQSADIVFGIAENLLRRNFAESLGARFFYWYSNRYLRLKIANRATFFICMNRNAANALTRSGRFMRHIRQMAQRVGFSTDYMEYKLPNQFRMYSHARTTTLLSRAIDLISNYSSHPLRVVSYFGLVAGFLNILYALYVVTISLSHKDIAKGWTTLSLQSSLMFFLLFMILAVLAEYIGKILNETQQEPPYHIMQELSSTINIADETRRNVTK